MGDHHQVRIVTATSLFDGHDASINIMRRILQAHGAEVIHLGHDRSAFEIAEAAIEEDAHAVAVTSYQGGHMEFFRFLRRLLDDMGGTEIRVFGGGGGTILPEEGATLADEGVARIYSPDDGRMLGLEGMIDDLIRRAVHEQPLLGDGVLDGVLSGDRTAIARAITAFENEPERHGGLRDAIAERARETGTPVVGFTGTGGAGKSSILDELVLRYRRDHPDRTIAVISVDPSRRRTGGALLGDRIRMNAVSGDQTYMRSLATRQANLAMSPHVADAVNVVKTAGFDLVFLETSGIGQSDTEIVDASDIAVYVMTPEYGAATQLEKIDMLDYADVIAINKSDRRGAEDALRDVRKQYRRNRQMFDAPDGDLPIVSTIASQFNDDGTQQLYERIMTVVADRAPDRFTAVPHRSGRGLDGPLVPRDRTRYLSEIADVLRAYDADTEAAARAATGLQSLDHAVALGVAVPDDVRARLEESLPTSSLRASTAGTTSACSTPRANCRIAFGTVTSPSSMP